MAVVNEVSTVSHIPQFVPFGLLYYTQDTGELYIGTGFSTGSDYVGGNPGPNVNVELISSPGGNPGGFNGDIQYNNNGNLGGSAATITAAGAINALSITATTATVTSTLELQTATIVDSLGSTGTVGQALESTGTGVKWAAVSSTETWAALTGAMTATQVAPWYNATSTIDSGISRLGAASLAIGNGTNGDFSGTLQTTIVNAVTGFQVNGAAPSGHILLGNGTNYVDSATLPSGTVTWDQIGNAAANLTLANAGFNTTFNQTSAVAWLWANTTTGTSLTTNASPLLELAANYYTGSASAADTWTIGSSLAAGTNGASTLTIAHSGTTGVAAISGPLFLAGNGTVNNVSYGLASHPTWGIWGANSGSLLTLTGGHASGAGVGVSSIQALFGLSGGWFTCAIPITQNGNPMSLASSMSLGWGSGNAGNSIDTGFSRATTNYLSIGTTSNIGDSSGNLSLATITGSATVAQLATTPNPTVGSVGFGSGATTWGYKVVAKDAFGSSIGSSEVTFATNATLSNATAGVKITPAACPGAKTYDVYRTTAGTAPNTTGKIATITLNNTNNYTYACDVGSLTLSAAANASGGNTVYTASMTNYAPQFIVGAIFVVTGFTTPANNGTFMCVAQTGSSLTLNNAFGVAETHAGTASQTGDGTTVPATNTTGTLSVPLLDIGGTDAGISRLGAASLAIGNGTAGDTSGELALSRINSYGADMQGSVSSAPTGIVATNVVVAVGAATATFTVSSTEGFTVGDTVTLSASGWTSGSGLASTTATVASVTSTTVLVLTYVSGGPWVAGTYTAQTGTLAQTGGTSVSVIYATAYTSTPSVVVTPTSNAGAFYISASSKTGFTITYATSGTQTFNYIVMGNPS